MMNKTFSSNLLHVHILLVIFIFYFILFYTVADEIGMMLMVKRILRCYPGNTLYSIKNIKQNTVKHILYITWKLFYPLNLRVYKVDYMRFLSLLFCSFHEPYQSRPHFIIFIIITVLHTHFFTYHHPHPSQFSSAYAKRLHKHLNQASIIIVTE